MNERLLLKAKQTSKLVLAAFGARVFKRPGQDLGGDADVFWEIPSLGDIPFGGDDGLPRERCAAGPTSDPRPGPPGDGTADHSHAWVPGQLTPLRPFGPLPVAAAPSRFI